MPVSYDPARVTVVDHPLVQHKLSILRDEKTGTKQFRDLVSELAVFEGYEATRDLPLEDVQVTTPIREATCKQLAGRKLAIVLARWPRHGRRPARAHSRRARGAHRHVSRRGHARAA